MRVVLKNVCKDIKGARVLDNVNLELESGRVYGSVSYTHLTLPTT